MTFVPHPACTVASGDCFRLGRCLNGCRQRAKRELEKRVAELERRLVRVELALAKKGQL